MCATPPAPLATGHVGIRTLGPPVDLDGSRDRPEAEPCAAPTAKSTHRLVRAVVGMAMEQGIEWSGWHTLAVPMPNGTTRMRKQTTQPAYGQPTTSRLPRHFPHPSA